MCILYKNGFMDFGIRLTFSIYTKRDIGIKAFQNFTFEIN